MKIRRALVFSLAALLLLTGVWIVGGNAWAARREEQCDKAWTVTFGSLEDLKATYPRQETNEAAKRLEEIANALGFDLVPAMRAVGTIPRRLAPAELKRGRAINDYLSAEISKPEDSIDPLPEEVAHFFEEKRAQIDAVESLLVAGPPPQWSFDLSIPVNERPMPSLIGQIRLQRVLLARALASAQGGHRDAVARALEASWNLNESLRGRPETTAIVGMAVSRLEVGVLRKADVEEDVWSRRLSAALDYRRLLLDGLVLDSRPTSSREWWTNASRSDSDVLWLGRAWDFLEAPGRRFGMIEYSEAMRAEFAQLRDAALSDHFPEPPRPAGGNLVQILASIQMPNIKNPFVRADRLIVDAELTSKILEAKRLRRESGGRWPATIPGIETSRFPGASWRYEASPDGRRMSIAFSRELASPYGQSGMKPLPLRFSSN